MALVRWDPFSELNSLHEQLNSLFNDSLGNSRNNSSLFTPTTDVYSNEKELTIETQLANFKEEEISVQQHDGELEIKAEHVEKERGKDRKYLIKESASRYYRRFALPKNSDSENIQASFKNGVLKLVVPYKELPQPKRISLDSGKKKQIK